MEPPQFWHSTKDISDTGGTWFHLVNWEDSTANHLGFGRDKGRHHQAWAVTQAEARLWHRESEGQVSVVAGYTAQEGEKSTRKVCKNSETLRGGNHLRSKCGMNAVQHWKCLVTRREQTQTPSCCPGWCWLLNSYQRLDSPPRRSQTECLQLRLAIITGCQKPTPI